MEWERPSPRACVLLQEAARRVLASPTREPLTTAVDTATLADQDAAFVGDPALEAAVLRANHSHVEVWLEAIVRDPGAPAAPNTSPEALASVRDLVRRGLDEAVIAAFRQGQNAAWSVWMDLMFQLTDDPAELRELLQHSARSMSTYTDRTLAAVSAQISTEREQLRTGTHAARLETVTLIIDGAPITRELAAVRLGYNLDGSHLAAIVWTEEVEPDVTALERGVQALASATGARQPLTVTASAGAIWTWLHPSHPPDEGELLRRLNGLATVRVALGRIADDLDGFRTSHLEALTTQRVLMRTAGRIRLATWEQVQLAALVGDDDPRAREFVRTTLGALATADETLRETVRVYLREQSNARRASELLYTHRNTVLTRVARAERLLPRPLGETNLEVAVALELLHWTG
jgi:DNA-binding PucR family transcriptional regulator